MQIPTEDAYVVVVPNTQLILDPELVRFFITWTSTYYYNKIIQTVDKKGEHTDYHIPKAQI